MNSSHYGEKSFKLKTIEQYRLNSSFSQSAIRVLPQVYFSENRKRCQQTEGRPPQKQEGLRRTPFSENLV